MLAVRHLLLGLAILGLTGDVFAVCAPSAEMSASGRRFEWRGGLLRPTTDFTHLRSALETKARRQVKSRLLKAAETIPSRWDSREHGWMTSIKNQESYGTCWTFSTMAALETAFLKATVGAVTNDFSENHMATHDVGFSFGFKDGGNNQVAAALLASWRDPLLESEDPYPNLNSRVELPPQCHVQDIVWLPERSCPVFWETGRYDVDPVTDNRAVDAAYKRAVMKYGAVSIGYYHIWGCYNQTTGAHYLSVANVTDWRDGGGHAVTLIGWDDDYPVENFRAGKRPPGKGAFLVKNSWGMGGSATNGCSWISYYDESVCDMQGAAYPLPEDVTNYGRIFEYDPCGQVVAWNSCDTDEEEALGQYENWCANVFTTTATGIVEAVGFYAMAAETAYTLRVCRNCLSSPADGEVVLTQSGTVAEAGYATIRLSTGVPIDAGEKFAVVLRLECPGYAYPLPVECTHEEPDGTGEKKRWCTGKANAGESFMSRDGLDWTDFQKYDPTGNFCIKAYTRFGSDGEFRKLIDSSEPTGDSLTARVGDSFDFVVRVEASIGGGESYEWRVNGLRADVDAPEFAFVPTFADHGSCAVECYVRHGSSVDVRRWSVLVNADLRVEAGSLAENPDGSDERPFATIPEACRAAVEGDVVLVGPGVYPGTLECPSAKIDIRSTEGPELTVLDAEGAGRCFYAGQNAETVLSGFTLVNGDAASGLGGGVCYGVVTNCVISNCVAAAGGGAAYATLLDSRVVDCQADYYGGGICDVTAEHCVLYGNVAWSDSGGGAAGYQSGCVLRHCTVFGNAGYASGGGVDYACGCEDSIVWDNFDGAGGISNWEKVRSGWSWYATSFKGSCTYPTGFADSGGNLTSDPLMVSLEASDWRLRAGSPCLGTAGDGTNMGAWQGEGLVGHVISTLLDGRGEVSPSAAFVLDGGEATFVASGDHPFLGFKTNGVWAADVSPFTLKGVHADVTLTACFGPTNYYVDAASGDDSRDGLTAATARRTLQSTVDRTWSGDVVRVNPGVYDGLEVPYAGVSVESTDGAAVTVLSTNAYGACFSALGEDVSLVGFTLRDARLPGQYGYGGGAYGGVLSGCVISNCLAAFGGGAYGAVLENCLLVGNRAESYWVQRTTAGGLGGGVANCLMLNCTVAGNSAASFGGGAYLDSGFGAINSIVADNVCDKGFGNGNDIYGKGYYETICSLSDQDAKFVDAAHGDWRLSARSPGVDAGSNAFVTAACDLSGNSRIVGPRVDMGCYEYCHAVPGWPTPTVTPETTPADEAAAVAAAMTEAGFTGEKATALSSVAQYAVLSDWAAAHGLTIDALNASPTALASAALGAPSLLTLTGEDLKLTELAPSSDGSAWTCKLTLDAYDAAKASPALLKAAVGVVGSETPGGTYSADGLGLSVRPVTDGIELNVTPPSAAKAYFMKSRVR